MADAFPSISIIIPRLKQGDETAWNDLCEKFRKGLASKTRFLVRRSSSKRLFSADDLVQETFLKAWNKHSSFRGETTRQFAKWILTIQRNTFLDWCRGEKPEELVATWFGFSSPADSPSSQMISQEQEACVHACIAELPSNYQEVLSLRHFEGLKFAEIAEHMNANINTVAGIYRRGLSQLMARMEKNKFDSVCLRNNTN